MTARNQLSRRLVAGAAALLFACLLVVQPTQPAFAKQPCHLVGQTDFDTSRPPGTVLWDAPVKYVYENPVRRFAGMTAPTAAELAAVPASGPERIYGPEAQARTALLRKFKEKQAQYQQRGRSAPAWGSWLPRYTKWVGVWARGKALERLVPTMLGLGPGWQCDGPIPGAENCKRHPDFFHVGLKIAIEIKANGRPNKDQLAGDRCIAEKTGYTMVTITAAMPGSTDRKLLDELAALPNVDATWYVAPTLGERADRPPPGAGRFVGRAQVPGTGATSELDEVPDTVEEAEEMAETIAELDAEEGGTADVEDLGGIDFSTLELRYLKDTHTNTGPGAAFAFGAKLDQAQRWSVGGRRAADLSSDAFFVFLALPPAALTVNLNPDEPDRIMDKRLGRTEPGRVMLEADLQLKKTTAALLHPDSATGKRYERMLNLPPETTLCRTTRTWIVPSAATVYEDDDELYILDADLGVRSETSSTKATAKQCPGQDPVLQRHSERVFNQEILPLVAEKVNEAPEYADLRRVYRARIAADWIRGRDQLRPTAYSEEIDSGDVAAWPLETAWNPKDVFRAYVRSYKEGEYRVTRKTTRNTSIGRRSWTRTYVQGGVDLSRVPKVSLTSDSAARLLPPAGLAEQSLQQPVSTESEIWLGGEAAGDPQRNGVAAQQDRVDTLRTAVIAAASLAAALVVAGAAAALITVSRRRRH